VLFIMRFRFTIKKIDNAAAGFETGILQRRVKTRA
jgi:hypothetical protein